MCNSLWISVFKKRNKKALQNPICTAARIMQLSHQYHACYHYELHEDSSVPGTLEATDIPVHD